ncbi:MAG: hypothetical protein LBM01_03595 [Christensenellaceae bacterium]|jgi:hypothetical protein|nr:hypothetical protein [Christensenellaceae bacterium]
MGNLETAKRIVNGKNIVATHTTTKDLMDSILAHGVLMQNNRVRNANGDFERPKELTVNPETRTYLHRATTYYYKLDENPEKLYAGDTSNKVSHFLDKVGENQIKAVVSITPELWQSLYPTKTPKEIDGWIKENAGRENDFVDRFIFDNGKDNPIRYSLPPEIIDSIIKNDDGKINFVENPKFFNRLTPEEKQSFISKIAEQDKIRNAKLKEQLANSQTEQDLTM